MKHERRSARLSRAGLWLVGGLLSVLVGCDEGGTVIAGSYRALTVEDGLFYSPNGYGEPGELHALVLDAAGDDPVLHEHALPGGGAVSFQRPSSGGRETVLLTSGLPSVLSGKNKRAAVPSHVIVFGRGGPLVDVELSGRYSRLSLSEDGRYAIAFGISGLSVENAVEVIDLVNKTKQRVDLSLDARVPSSFVFAPLGGYVRRLAIAPLSNALQVIDLENPGRGPISITLSEQRALEPAQFVFSGDRIFVRSRGATDIVTLQNIEVARGNHPWQFAPGVLVASDAVRDIAVTGEGPSKRLLALSSSLEVFDPDIGVTAKVDGVSGFSSIVLFTGRSPVDAQALPRAMLYGTEFGGPGTPALSTGRVGFVDLGDETAWATRNIEFVELGASISSLTALSTKKLAVARHAGAMRASVIDLEQRTVRRLVLDGLGETLLLDETPTRRFLWARGSTGRVLGRVDLDSFVTHEVPWAFGETAYPSEPDENTLSNESGSLGRPDHSLLRVPSPTRARLAVLQQARTGHVTFIDADDPKPETALDVMGVFLTDLLD